MDGNNADLGDLESRAAYLSGLVKGLGLGSYTDEGRVLEEVVDLLVDVVREVSALEQVGRKRSVRQVQQRDGADRATFVACECPRCGEDVFARIEPHRGEGPSPDTAPLEFEVTCSNCGNVLTIREAP